MLPTDTCAHALLVLLLLPHLHDRPAWQKYQALWVGCRLRLDEHAAALTCSRAGQQVGGSGGPEQGVLLCTTKQTKSRFFCCTAVSNSCCTAVAMRAGLTSTSAVHACISQHSRTCQSMAHHLQRCDSLACADARQPTGATVTIRCYCSQPHAMYPGASVTHSDSVHTPTHFAGDLVRPVRVAAAAAGDDVA